MQNINLRIWELVLEILIFNLKSKIIFNHTAKDNFKQKNAAEKISAASLFQTRGEQSVGDYWLTRRILPSAVRIAIALRSRTVKGADSLFSSFTAC